MTGGAGGVVLVAPAVLAPVVAHQGGWDEVLLFGVPAILAVVAVRWAEKRAKDRREADSAIDGGEGPSGA